jgi:hypothetical protein
MVAGVAGRLAMAAGVVALAPAPARADSFDAWQKQTSDKGCYLYMYLPSVGGMDTDPNPDGFVWTGPCTPGQPVNGTGTWYMQTNYPMSDGSVLKRVMSQAGTVRNGLFEGYVTRRTYAVDDNGRWDPNAGQIDEFWGEGAEFRAGCEADQIMEGAMAEYGCQPGTQGNAIVIPRVTRPYFPLPAAAPAQALATPDSSAPPSRLPATYTTVGGVPVAPPATFAAAQENALATVADGLLMALGGSEGPGFADGGTSIETILASLRTTLGLNAGAALGGRPELLAFVLGEVRKSVSGADPALTNGQMVQLVMGTVRRAIASGNQPAPPAAQGGGKLVSAADIDSVIEYLRGKGGQFNVEETAQGTPGLREASGLFNVFLLGCDANNRQCVTIQFRACSAEYPNASLAKANGWNRQYSYAKVYLDQNGNVCVEQTVPTGRGGISADALDIAFDAFAWLRDNMGRQFN